MTQTFYLRLLLCVAAVILFVVAAIDFFGGTTSDPSDLGLLCAGLACVAGAIAVPHPHHPSA